ncbi:putative TatD family hydrolase [Seiridium unicorne]|uniref:TatD family hydrolase n=1 Tax=Seiridium unicorne TaxID=138068 RepID=A0ABR2V6Z5_9PEZI
MSSSDIPTNLDIAQSHPSKSRFVTIGIHSYHSTEPFAEGPAYYEEPRQSIRETLAEDSSPLRALDLPLFLHCRASFDDFVQVISPYVEKLPRRGLVHSFVGTKAQMERLVELGLDISVNGFSFQDRESLDMVAAIPLENLQTETDAPWGEI